MSESYGDPQKDRNLNVGRGSLRGGNRGPGNREGGGFRIRLSDNEMRASRAIQEAFNLRSTVAVLGFALRTLGQMLEEGKLDNLIAEYRSQAPSGNINRNKYDYIDKKSDHKHKATFKPDPFARPTKPESVQTDEAKKNDQEENEINNLDEANTLDTIESSIKQSESTNSTNNSSE